MRMRLWHACGEVMLVVVLLLVGLYVALNLFRDKDQAHKAAPHGGVVVLLEEGGDHDHIEAVVERERILKLDTFGEEVNQAREIESLVLAAVMTREVEDGFTPVEMMLMPWPSNSDDRTTQFFSKLLQRLRVNPLVIRSASVEATTLTVTPKVQQALSPRRLWEGIEKAGDEPSRLKGPSGTFTRKPKV